MAQIVENPSIWSACIQCGACVAVCPQPAGFISAFDTIAVGEVCDIACMACEHICPVHTIDHVTVGEERVLGQQDHGGLIGPC